MKTRHRQVVLTFLCATLFAPTLRAEAPTIEKLPQLVVFAPPSEPGPPNTMMTPISREARLATFRTAFAGSPYGVRDFINLLAHKIQAASGLSFDDVVASLKARANRRNFKLVGVNAIYKDVEAITGKPSPRVEVFNLCDALVARQLLDFSPEAIIFLPCRIAVIEDAEGKIWVITLDWDIKWLAEALRANFMPDSLAEHSVRIRDTMEDIMQAAAKGDL